ncbi:MAG TPA: hydroxymethylbilane synthase [Solirubrobacteraceae bacterium]
MRIGTRGSALALAQARLVAGWLGGAEIVVVRTRGDTQNPQGGNGHGARILAGTSTGAHAGASKREPRGEDKSRWVAELEQALLTGEIDLAVHSAKDVPGELAAGLGLLGAPARATPADALIGAHSLEDLPRDARVGTSSVRRAAQLLAVRDDLEIVSLRGNVDTRLRKLAEEVIGSGKRGARPSRDDSGHGGVSGGHSDGGDPRESASLHAIVLASAGLKRLGRERDIGCLLDPARFVPAPGQGALALQARIADASVREAVEPILDKDTSACLLAERAVAHALGASCNTPLGAHAVPAGCGCLNMRAWIGLPDGSEWIADELLGGFYDPEELGTRVAQRLEAAGARGLLERAAEMAVEHP